MDGFKVDRRGRLIVDMEAVGRLPAAEQALVAELLKDYEAKLARNPLLRYRPASCWENHPDQLPSVEVCTPRCKHSMFHLADQPLKAFFGGNRAGKTTTALVDDLIQMTPIMWRGEELLPPHLQQYKRWECPFYCRVMTPDMQRTMVPVIYEKLREWTPKALLRGGSFDKAFDKTAQSLRLECGCRFDFLSYEMDVDKFGGAALHRCHYDEEPPASIRKECLMRLVDFNGQELLSMTPLKGITWTYRQVWKPTDPNIYKTKVSLKDNPLLHEGAEARVKAMAADDAELSARLHGDFIHEGGLVYPLWRHCVVEPREREQLRPLEHVCAIDPGIRFAGITCIAFDEDNASHTWRTVKLRNAVAEDYAEWIKDTYRRLGVPLDDVHMTIDPSAVSRSAAAGENVLDELMRYDIYCSRANNSVETGVKQLRRRMRNDWCTIADPEIGGFTGDTSDLLDELEEYAMDIDENADDGEFKVVKMNDHVADAWRYGHMERPWLPEVRDEVQQSGLPWWQVASGPQKRVTAGSRMGAEV